MDSLQPPSSPATGGGGDTAGAGSRRVSVRLTNGQVVNCDTRKVLSHLIQVVQVDPFRKCGCSPTCSSSIDC